VAKFAVIVPAAGQSKRFGNRPKKPFANLDGRPVFLRTLERFINRDDVCQTILVVAPEDLEDVKRRYGANLAFMGVSVVEGGKERHDSVAAALQKIAEDAQFVAIHDAVRPCVTDEMIDAVFKKAAETGAAILASQVRATLKRVNEQGQIETTVPREGLYEAQTPQVFRKDWLLEAYSKRQGAPDPITDDAQLLELAGHKVHVVESDPSNIKITTQGDIRLAEAILKSRPRPKAKPLRPFEEAQW